MQVTSPSSVSTPLPDGATALAGANQTLGQEDFLKLLVAQMSSQDPLNPQSDLDSIAQMAQFSGLEQNKATQAEIAGLRNDQQLQSASNLLGRSVTLQSDAETLVSGTVDAVQVSDGTPYLIVGDACYSLSQLLSVTQAPVLATHTE